MWKDKLKKADIILILIVIILSVSLILFMRLTDLRNDKSNIVININGNKISKIPLNELDESKLYMFDFEQYEGYIETKNGKVRMLEMDTEICPEAICSETGWIDKSYQSIICHPNKIIVTIEGKDEELIDAIAQ